MGLMGFWLHSPSLNQHRISCAYIRMFVYSYIPCIRIFVYSYTRCIRIFVYSLYSYMVRVCAKAKGCTRITWKGYASVAWKGYMGGNRKYMHVLQYSLSLHVLQYTISLNVLQYTMSLNVLQYTMSLQAFTCNVHALDSKGWQQQLGISVKLRNEKFA